MCKRGSRRRKCHGRGEIRESTRNQNCHMVRISLDFKFLRSKNKLPCDVNVVFLSNPNPDPWTLRREWKRMEGSEMEAEVHSLNIE